MKLHKVWNLKKDDIAAVTTPKNKVCIVVSRDYMKIVI